MDDGMSALPMPARLSKQATLDALSDTCRNLLIRPQADIDSEAREEYSPEEVGNAAQRGCPICVRLHWSLTASGQPADTILKDSYTVFLTAWTAVLIARGDDAPVLIERGIAIGGYRSLNFLLGPTAQINNQLLVLKKRSHPTDPYNVPVAESVASHSCSDSSFARICFWLEDCDRDHAHCQGLAAQETVEGLPMRLIDVESAEKPYLVTVDQIPDKCMIRYATLSHGCGDVATMPKLLKSNLREFQKDINTKNLPKVFSDCMLPCRRI